MHKYHNIVSALVGILFLLLVQLFSAPEANFLVFSAAYAAYIGAVTWYNHRYLSRMGKLNRWLLVRPVLLLVSAFALSLVVPNAFLRGIFLMVSVFVIGFFEAMLGNFVENVMVNETLLVSFGFFVALAAFREYFPLRQTWGVVATFLAVLLAARSFYEFAPQQPRVKMLAAGGVALFLAELYWAFTFLPFHYSAIAVLLLSFFYFCLMVNHYAFLQVLTPKKIYFHLILMALSIGIVLIITPWEVLR